MTRAYSILIVDGDPAMRATLRELLTHDGAFTVLEAADARMARASLAARAEGFSALIVDAALPDDDGHALCAALRAEGITIPMIILDGAGRRDGAPDTTVIVKPFRLSELMTRLRAHLDSAAMHPPAARFRVGRFECHPGEKALRDDSASLRIRLTEKETAILAFLHRMGGRAVPRMELLREVWGYNPSVTTHTLETHVYRLRRKLEPDPANARLLITEAGGYRLSTT